LPLRSSVRLVQSEEWRRRELNPRPKSQLKDFYKLIWFILFPLILTNQQDELE